MRLSHTKMITQKILEPRNTLKPNTYRTILVHILYAHPICAHAPSEGTGILSLQLARFLVVLVHNIISLILIVPLYNAENMPFNCQKFVNP